MWIRTSGAGIVLALAAAMLALAAPANAASPSVTIASSADPVAVGQDLSINTLVVRNNTATALTTVDVRFDLVQVSPADPWPFDFDSPQTDAACHLDAPVVPSYVVDCHYAVSVAAGGTAGIAVRLHLAPSTDSATAPSPLLKITVGTGSDTDSMTVGPIVRVKRTADLAVRVAGSLTARVGGIVNVQWIVTNLGPDTVDALQIILVAPSGTEWTGAAAKQCDPPAIPKIKYECISNASLAPGHVLTETWQLKIDSAPIGTGQFSASYDFRAGSLTRTWLSPIRSRRTTQ